MNISVVIPNYNGKDILLANLPKVIAALKTYTGGNTELIITDDASKDGSIEALSDFFLKIKKSASFSYQILKNPLGKNRGFAGNVNVGVRAAKGDVIVLLNSDVAPHSNFLDSLIPHFSESSIFAVGCMDESVETDGVVLRGRGVGKWERGFLSHTAGSLDQTNTLWVSCGSGAFRKSIWDTIGGLNEIYNPFYWEDIDLSYKAQKLGYEVRFEKKSRVVHEHSKGAIKKYYSPLSVRKIVYRNQFLFTWLNLTDTMLIVKHFLWLPYQFARAVKHIDVAFFYGFFLALSRLHRVASYRWTMAGRWKKTDKEIVAPYLT